MTLNTISSAVHHAAPSAPPLDSSQAGPSRRPEYSARALEDQQRLAEQVLTALQHPSDQEIAEALKALDTLLLSAEQQASELMEQQPVDAQHLQQQAARYVFDDENPLHRDLERALSALPADVGDSVSDSADPRGCWSRLVKIVTVLDQGYDHVSRYCGIALDFTTRALICVGLPTLARQMIAYELEFALKSCGATRPQRFALASVAALVPVLLNLAGGLRDYLQGTETAITRFARGFNILISSASLIAAASTGVLGGIASTLVSFQLYSLMREGLQTCLRMSHVVDIKKKSTLISAGLYVPNQIAANLAMTRYASPSGAAAAIGSDIDGDQTLNNLVRAGINTVGEATESFLFGQIHAIQNDEKFKTRLVKALPDRKYVADALFNTLAARSTLMNTPLLASASLETAFGEYFDAETRILINDVLCACILGAGYTNFVNTVTGHKKPEPQE